MSALRPIVGSVASAPSPSPVSIAVQFVLTASCGGSSFLFIAIALTGMTPAQVAGGRLLFGALALGAIVAIRRERLPRDRRVWGHLCVLGFSFCVVPFLLFAWAEQHVSSGLASIFNATTPIMTAIMAWAVFRVERLELGQLLGIAVGIAGVVVIIAPGAVADVGDSTIAQLALLGATACYGFSLAYMRRFLGDTGLSGIAFAFGTSVRPRHSWCCCRRSSSRSRCASTSPSSRASSSPRRSGHRHRVRLEPEHPCAPGADDPRVHRYTYITPVVGVALGILVLGERISWNEPVGAAVVFLGILLVQQRLRLPRRAHA